MRVHGSVALGKRFCPQRAHRSSDICWPASCVFGCRRESVNDVNICQRYTLILFIYIYYLLQNQYIRLNRNYIPLLSSLTYTSIHVFFIIFCDVRDQLCCPKKLGPGESGSKARFINHSCSANCRMEECVMGSSFSVLHNSINMITSVRELLMMLVNGVKCEPMLPDMFCSRSYHM